MSSPSTDQTTKSSNRGRSSNKGGGGNRNRSRGGQGGRGRGRGRKPAPPKEPSLGEKILSIVTFGLAGGDKKEAAQSSPPKKSGKSPSGGKSGRPSQKKKKDRPQRTPELVEVTSERLYVGNLDYDATESDLFELFNGVGQVQNAEIVCHRYNQRSKGYAFVEMNSMEEAKRAVDVLHDQDFMGRKLWVSGAKSRGPKGGGGSEGGGGGEN